MNLEPPIDLKNADSAPDDAQPVVKEMNEKVHEKLEEKISKLEKKVDALKEDIREKQEEIDKDHKTPVEVKGHKEAKVKEPVDEPVPRNDHVELKSGGGVADKHPSHVIKDPDHVIDDPDHVIKDPDHVIKDPDHVIKDHVPEANGNAPEINQVVVQEAINADNVGVANPVGVTQPADKLGTKLEKVKEMNVENKELNAENMDFKSLESNQGHLAAVRDLKSKP